MSKKFKSKTCVYCGKEPSTTADHVIARKFFLEDQRVGLPKVPACLKCNQEKSRLEHYLTLVLPFGARHQGAALNLETMVPGRLERNLRLKRSLSDGLHRKPHGEVALPLDPKAIEGLFGLIAKGLAWHHFNTLIGPGFDSLAGAFTDSGIQFFDQVFMGKSKDRISKDFANGTFSYEGAQAVDMPQLTGWKFSVYGGIVVGGDPAFPKSQSSRIVAVTATSKLIKQLRHLVR